jgi:hypothetical protein
MPTSIQLIEIDGQHWVSVSLDGLALERRGPFPDVSAAEAMAARLAAICRELAHGTMEVHHGGRR